MTRGWVSELWTYRELLYFLAWRDIKIRYKQAVLGAAWAVIQPLFTMLVFTFFFSGVAGINASSVPYPLFSFSGLVAWFYFATTMTQAGNSLVSNSNLVTKVYFPRMLLPAAAALNGLFDLAIGTAFLLLMMLYYGVIPGWQLLLAPLFVAMIFFLALGASMFLAALNVRYRDVKHAIPFVVQLGIFLTPVIYPVTFLPAEYRGLLAWNPMAGIIEGWRASLLPDQPLDWGLVSTSAAVTTIVFIVGALYFHRAERAFADVV
jgi:lipopolysaccharide transport system permease protein